MGTGSSKVSGGGSGGFKLIKNAKEFDSTAEADAFFGNNLDALTKKQKDTLTWYTGGDFYDFNQALRNDAPENLDKLKSMDAAMKKSVLTEPITVSRGSTADLLGFKSKPTIAELKELIGGEFMDKAFVSTSAKKGGGFTSQRRSWRIRTNVQNLYQTSHTTGRHRTPWSLQLLFTASMTLPSTLPHTSQRGLVKICPNLRLQHSSRITARRKSMRL